MEAPPGELKTATRREVLSTACFSSHCSVVALVMLPRLLSKSGMSRHSSKSVQPDASDFMV